MKKQKLSEVFKIKEADGMFGGGGGSTSTVGTGSPGVDSPLAKLSPQEKQSVDAWMKGGGDVEMDPAVYDKLMDFYSDEMPYGTQKGRDGDPDQWIFDKLEDLPEYQ